MYDNESFLKQLCESETSTAKNIPSRKDAMSFLGGLISLMFPITEGENRHYQEVCRRWEALQERFKEIIRPLMDKRTDEVSDRFFAAIPEIYEYLVRDAEIYSECDPASFSMEEVILCYPGFYAIMVYRISHVLYTLEVPVLPRIISEYAHSKTGIDIHPGATIGRHLYIDHGTGIVIGQTTVIGDNVKIYQGVTLGATFVDKDLRGKRRHPKIEDGVIIYAGSTILGGDTVVGRDSVIGGNVWLTESVPAGSKVYHKPEIIIKGER